MAMIFADEESLLENEFFRKFIKPKLICVLLACALTNLFCHSGNKDRNVKNEICSYKPIIFFIAGVRPFAEL